VEDSGWTVEMTEICRIDILGDCVIHHQSTHALRRLYDSTVTAGGISSQIIHRDAFSLMSGSENNFWNKLTAANVISTADSLVYGQIVTVGNNTYFMMLNSNLTPVNATVSTLRIQLLYISAGLLLVALILSVIIASRLSRPITGLIDSAHQLAAGDFTVTFDGGGYREINDLADTLNFAARELGRSDQLQRDILANITHDLRTPMTMIGGYAEYMRDFPEEDHSESLEVIIEESRRMSKLINDVLDFSKLSAGVVELDRQEFDLTEMLREFTDNYNLLVTQDGFRVVFESDRNVTVSGDRAQLQRAVGNMVNNALTHCGSDQCITVRQIVNRRSVRVEISDHGPGIRQEDLTRIWERYYHADAPQRGGKGSGLGLSIVKGIMELHNAKYGVDSTLGEGSTFWFELKR